MSEIFRKTFLFALAFAATASFAAFYGNQSAINWKSVETDRFYVHYPAEFREQAAVATDFAESVYDTLTKRYRIKLPDKVNLVLGNALFSNGEANPVYNMMRIELTNWDFKIRGTHSWISDVITHEFSHLASMQNGSKTPFPWIQGVQISSGDFYNEKKQISTLLYFPFMIQPFWFAEGTAQYESARMGFDRWDTHRDMLLRTAFLENSVLPLEFMEDFSGQSLEAELGPYTQGFDLVRYIAEVYGDSALPELWKDMGGISRLSLSTALTYKLKIDERELYENWKKDRRAKYEAVRDSVGDLFAGEKISKDFFYNDFLSVAGGKLYGLSNFGGDFFDGGIFELNSDKLKQNDTLQLKQYEKFKLEKPYLSQGMSVRQTPKGLLLAYTNYQNRDKKGKLYFDIAIADTNGNSHLITKFADAVYPNISPDGKQVVFARREKSGTRFYLSIASTDSLGDINDISQPIPIISNPQFSPDGKRIVFSYYDNVSRKIAIVNSDGTNFETIIEGDFDSRDPAWSTDGNSIYFSSDADGIFNLYVKKLEGGKIDKITTVLGGAFSPTPDTNGIYYIGYDKDGFSVYKIDAPHSLSYRAQVVLVLDTGNTRHQKCNDKLPMHSMGYFDCILAGDEPQSPIDLTVEGKEGLSFANAEKNYSPIPRMPILIPLLSFDDRPPDFGAINEGIITPKLGFAFGLNDPLNKNFFQLAALQQLGKFGEDSQSDLLASLENRSTPITINLAVMRTNTPSKDTVRYEDPRSYEDSLSLSEYASELYTAFFAAGYSVFKQGDSLSLFASYDLAKFNLYQDGFAWDYHKRLQTGAMAGFTQRDSIFGVQGLYSYSSSDLFRPGTFAESFTISDAGVITPHYRHFNLHEWAFSAFFSLPNPIQKNGKFSLSFFGNGILSWNSTDSDTLDNFYLHPLVIDGYPILQNAESYFRQGTGTILADFRYKFPIWNDFRNRFGIFTTRDFSVQPFIQAGSVWGTSYNKNLVRSVGIEWFLENRIFYSVPFNIGFGVAHGLDSPKDTRLKFSVGM
ncbi:hypothetical protein AGMMS49938_11540 [Fibrobacterales bacterium]|nr:hypothetical protein AGMMS49938_11540 [Fibrobacterales bacterium]